DCSSSAPPPGRWAVVRAGRQPCRTRADGNGNVSRRFGVTLRRAMIFAPRRVAGTLVLLLAFVGCGPRAAVSGTSSPTPDCSPQGVSVTTIVTRVVAVATAVGVVSQIAPGGAETPTTVPRAQLVAEAVATATAVARIPTPTPQPTSTPTPQPAGTPTP